MIRFERIWAMPSKWTFTIAPIAALLEQELLGTSVVVDPFAGYHSPGTLTNDLDPQAPTQAHIDALEWLQTLQTGIADAVLYDPPYSYRQATEAYQKRGREKLTATVTNAGYWGQVKNELARVANNGARAICLGWNTNGLGKCRGFQLVRVLIVPHGAHANDTLVTVESCLQPQLGGLA